MSDNGPNESFGCSACWPPSAEGAWKARQDLLEHEEDIVNESHYHVMILKCPTCAQRFISIFSEQIDWVAGEDPQYWTVMPLTPEETADLVRRGSSLPESDLMNLAPARRSLQRDFSAGAHKPSVFWSMGIWFPWHD